MNKRQIIFSCVVLTLAISLSCGLQSPGNISPSETLSSAIAGSTPLITATESTMAQPTSTELIPVTGHLMKPADLAPQSGTLVYDVESSGIAAPYGDSFKLNRLERPFLADMTYVSDMDIVTFNLSEDSDWYYVSIELSGKDPNNSLGINYGVEIDLDFDGYGDYVLWSHPPYTNSWETANLKIFKDSDHDSGGLSSTQSDAALDSNGYEELVFDGQSGQTDDPDLAWIRVNAAPKAVVQFAFKKSLVGSFFMLGVVSDGGLKDITKFDYNDHFDEADAGSPEQSKIYYPLRSLYGVDNTCWEAYGIQTTGFEPKLCQPILQPTPVREPVVDDTMACIPAYPPESCGLDPNGNPFFNWDTCECG